MPLDIMKPAAFRQMGPVANWGDLNVNRPAKPFDFGAQHQKEFEAGKLFDYQTEGYRIPFNEAGKGLNNAAYDKVGLNGQGNVINAQTFNAPTTVSNNTITPKRLPSPNFGGRVGEGDKFLS